MLCKNGWFILKNKKDCSEISKVGSRIVQRCACT